MRLCLLLAAAAGARARLAPRERERARLTGGRRLSDSNPGVSFEQLVKMTASDAATGDSFGNSVAIDGDTVVIGAYENSRGAAYVFRTSDGGATYVELARLMPSDATNDFSYSVAIDGNTVVIGAPQYTSGPGAVYVFRTTDGGATYGQVAILTASDAAEDDYFGASVAIDGDTVVISASGDDDGGDASGSVYVFRTTNGGTTYVEVAKLTAADAAKWTSFGSSVGIDGNTIVVGAYRDDGPTNSGSVYIFRTTDGGATYAQVAKLKAADADWYDYFGWSVAIDGNTVVVGAEGDDPGGSAYVFRTTDGGATYGQVAKLTADDAASGDDFGGSVAIDGTTIVVGANDAGTGGVVYVFLTTDGGATYDEIAKLTAADAAAGDEFGYSVAIDGGTIVVGAYGESYDRGAAYLFSPPAPTAQPTPKPTPRPTSTSWSWSSSSSSSSGSSSQKSNEDDVEDDDKMMTLVVLAGLLGLSLAAGLLLFALHQQQLAAKKSRAPRTSTVTAVEPRAPSKLTVTAVEPRAPRKFTVAAVQPRAPRTSTVTAVEPRAPRKFTVTAVQSV